jgi:hypothetical protein
LLSSVTIKSAAVLRKFYDWETSMGFFDFVKDAGAQLFNTDAEAARNIKEHLEIKTSGIKNIDVSFDGRRAGRPHRRLAALGAAACRPQAGCRPRRRLAPFPA